MKKYLHLVKKQMNLNFVAKFVQVPREENEHTDHLAKATSVEHIIVGSQVLSFI